MSHEKIETGLVPVVTEDTRTFWEGLRDRVLLLQRCGDCSTWIHYPAPRCTNCHSTNVSFIPVDGRGTIYTFTVVHREFVQGLPPPYVAALVDIDAAPGVRLTTRLVECEPSNVKIGIAVEPIFRPLNTEAGLLLYRPAVTEHQ